ncbi:single-stranded DNA-binding protein [Pseudanabaena sp. FACHB-1998]|uniref:single-stranded DNA-binding protein n=1 Tax=Pseudanabaena sp. FACHB-1998 TaxID=2692858 RepID=UPI001681A6AB|nr:single-stranded DNA-binding protein [Pseudanabaena sp. FACHB-1998]MBD2177384.1 single-stranded DNA-binding protein [Pseudanabaena sp. FACHB-1998]
MNSIVLMAEVLTDPELRRTPDNQSSIASFLVQFAGGRSEDAPYRIKVVGWNNLADEIMEKYHKGDQVVVEGRLRLDVVDRGTYKEKRTELVAQRVHGFGSGGSTATAPISSASAPAKTSSRTAASNPPAAQTNVVPMANTYVPVASPVADAPDYDDIPF